MPGQTSEAALTSVPPVGSDLAKWPRSRLTTSLSTKSTKTDRISLSACTSRRIRRRGRASRRALCSTMAIQISRISSRECNRRRLRLKGKCDRILTTGSWTCALRSSARSSARISQRKSSRSFAPTLKRKRPLESLRWSRLQTRGRLASQWKRWHRLTFQKWRALRAWWLSKRKSNQGSARLPVYLRSEQYSLHRHQSFQRSPSLKKATTMVRIVKKSFSRSKNFASTSMKQRSASHC